MKGKDLKKLGLTLARAVQVSPGVNLPRILNYHNGQDFALLSWIYNQDMKPTVIDWGKHYFYSKQQNFWGKYQAEGNLRTRLSLPKDTFEIFAFSAEARTYALGAAVGNGFTVKGEISTVVDLNQGDFLYKSGTHEHSAQFLSTNMRRTSYYQNLLNNFLIDQRQ